MPKSTQPGPSPPQRPSRWAVVSYALLWVVAGCLVLAFVVYLIRLTDDDVVSPSPAQRVELAAAVRTARCELREHRSGQVLSPPVHGEAAPPARPGVYDRTPGTAALVGAMRRGYVIIHYRPGLAKSRIDELREVQRAVPSQTVVAPDEGMRHQLAVTAWHRSVGCRTFNDDAIAVVRLFRAGYLGSGPDAPRGQGW